MELEDLSVEWSWNDNQKTKEFENNKTDGHVYCIQTKLKTLHIKFWNVTLTKFSMNAVRDVMLMYLRCAPNLQELSLHVV